jgi:putative protein-disulfide isomerase
VRTLFYFHDPMCSWCWGFRPTTDKLFAALPANVQLKKIVGGLAPDSDEPMSQDMRDGISAGWRRIQAMLGTEFNFDFWTECEPRRSTYPACRAVIAAAFQDQEDNMINAIQQAYYLRAMNPSDIATLEIVAGEIGLDVQRFATDLRSNGLEKEFQRQLEFTRRAAVRGFPSLVLESSSFLQSIALDHTNHEVTLQHIVALGNN